MMQENGMMLEVLPLEAGGARLVRVYGQDPCVVLPGSVLIFQGPAKGLKKNQQTQPVRRRIAP